MKVELRWHGPIPPAHVVAQVERECAELLENGLTAPHELIFHNVFLGKTLEGPSVFVFGDPKLPDEFQCEYTEETVWKSIGRTEDDKEIRVVDIGSDDDI